MWISGDVSPRNLILNNASLRRPDEEPGDRPDGAGIMKKSAALQTEGGRDLHRATILIVDDEPLARDAMVELLELRGYQTIAIPDGEGIFQWLERVDLILLDAMLPGRDGWSICREIKEEYDPFLPIIMVTARATTADMARTFDAHADDFLTKPFQPTELMARIESRLRLRKLERELQDLAAQNYRLYQQAAAHAAEKEMLLRELDHRVRNNLAIITGLASLERCRRPARPSDEALASLENRFRVFLLAFDTLHQNSGRSAPIRKIVEPVLQRLRNMAISHKDIEIEVSGQASDLDEKQATALALILYETVNNSIEHAFPGESGGTISVAISEIDDEIQVRVDDDGIGFAPEEQPEVLASGHSIVRALAHGNLGGEVQYLSGPKGTRVIVRFPRTAPDPQPALT